MAWEPFHWPGMAAGISSSGRRGHAVGATENQLSLRGGWNEACSVRLAVDNALKMVMRHTWLWLVEET